MRGSHASAAPHTLAGRSLRCVAYSVPTVSTPPRATLIEPPASTVSVAAVDASDAGGGGDGVMSSTLTYEPGGSMSIGSDMQVVSASVEKTPQPAPLATLGKFVGVALLRKPSQPADVPVDR